MVRRGDFGDRGRLRRQATYINMIQCSAEAGGAEIRRKAERGQAVVLSEGVEGCLPAFTPCVEVAAKNDGPLCARITSLRASICPE